MYMRIDFLFSYLIQIQGKYQTNFVRENSNFENIFCEKKLMISLHHIGYGTLSLSFLSY